MIKLLVVEDNKRSRYLLEQSLLAKGYEVVTAENGAIALELIRQSLPDLVISDIMMPVMNGYRLCRELKRDPALSQLPLIFYTATFVEKEDERLAMSLGAFCFIVKPCDEAVLDAAIREALKQGRPPEDEHTPDERRELDSMLDLYDNSVARKLAEKVEALQEERARLVKSELRLKEAQEIAQVGHWEYDFRTGHFLWSDEVCRTFGTKPSDKDFTHEQMLALVHPDDLEHVERSYRSLVEQMITYDITYRIRLQDGSVRFVNERGQTLCNDFGEPLSAIGTVQNVTEQKTTEIELKKYREQLEKIIERRTHELQMAQAELVKNERLALLGQLAATVSHELRNPLGTIGNVLDVVEHGMRTGDLSKIDEKIKLANRNVDRCDRIINELLEFASSKPPQITRVVFDEQLKASLDDLNWPDDVACELSLAVTEEVFLDPALLHRILNNLVNNAFQAFEGAEREDKTVKVESMLNDRVVTITVQDNGAGIAEANLPKIFEPLFSTKPFGVGLGMSIVRNAVSNLNGEITVDSTEGAGTTVIVSFPV